MILAALLLAFCSDEPLPPDFPSAYVRDDEAPVGIDVSQAGRMHTGARRDPTDGRTWVCQRIDASRSGEVDLSLRADALLGASAPAAPVRILSNVPEAWIAIARGVETRLELRVGRAPVEPGPGLSFHPSLILPWHALDASTAEDPEVRNPVGAEASLRLPGGLRTAIQAWPALDSSSWPGTGSSTQSPTWRLEQDLSLPWGDRLRLEAGGGRFTSFGGGWERSIDDWHLSVEAAARDDHPAPRIDRDDDGNWHIAPASRRMLPTFAAQLQRDLEIPVAGRIRASAEWIEAPEGFAHRAWLRLGSVQSARWSAAASALLYGPTAGALARVEGFLSLGDALKLSAWSERLFAFGSDSPLHDLEHPFRLGAALEAFW